MSNPTNNKTITTAEKKKMYNKKYYDGKKAKIHNEKVENEKKGVVIEETSIELKELKKQLNDIQYAITRLLADKIVKDADEDNTHVNPEPIKRFIKSLEVASSSYQSQSEDESNTEESEFEIDADGNII
jgi:hypothetical protein